MNAQRNFAIAEFDLLGQVLERCPRTMILLDHEFHIRVANHAARELYEIQVSEPITHFSSMDHTKVQRILTQAISRSKPTKLRIFFHGEPRALIAWRVNPAVNGMPPMLMLKGDESNVLAARLNRIERSKELLSEKLIMTRIDRDSLKRSARRLEILARTDPLTNLLNIRGFRESCNKRIPNPERVFSVIYIDLNGFKAVNDEFGHAAGDHVLKEVSVRLRRSVREGDIIGRIGGDEFCVFSSVLSGIELERMEKDLKAIVDKPISWVCPKGKSVVLPYNGASFGIATERGGALHLNELMRRADARMFAEKRSSPDKAGVSRLSDFRK